MPRQTGRYNRLSSYATKWWISDNGHVAVTYHSTTIVRTYDYDGMHWCELNTGGYYSVTTKRKMNQAAGQFDLPYSVHQKKHRWYVTTKAGVFEFDDQTFVFDLASGLPAAIIYAVVNKGNSNAQPVHA
jgi:hypothetical protein